MHISGLTAVFTALLCVAMASAQTPDILPFHATETTLANGLKVIVVPTGFPNLVSIQIPVQAGSRNEVEPGKSGFAHFFEHLMFRGTPNNPPARFRQIMTKAGARDNAGTGDDFTRYYSTFAKEDLETIVGLYADMFQHLSYAEADFKTEARAILGEYNKNSAEPLEKLFEVQRDRFYQVHTYKHTTMGFIKDIENMPNEYAYSKTFFERWYRPQYTTVIVAGDVTPEQVLPMVEKYWGGWKGSGAEPAGIPREPAPNGPIYVHVPWASETLPWVTVGFPGPAFDETSKESAAMEILGSVFFGQTSDLYKKLVVTEQKVDELEVDVPSSVDPSLFTVLARVKNGADTPYVRDQILAAVARARASLVPADRLADAKSFDRYSFARSIDSTERVAAVVSRYASYKRSYQTINNYYRTLESLTPADLQSAARRYFDDRGLIVATLSRDPLPAGIDRAPSLAAFEAQPRTASGSGGDVTLVLQKSLLPQLDVKLLFTVGFGPRPVGEGRPGGAHRGDDDGSRLENHDHRSDRCRALPDGGVVHESNRQGNDHADGSCAPRPMAEGPAHRLTATARSRLAPGGFRSRQDPADQRARTGSALEQRRGARERAPADEHLSRHARTATSPSAPSPASTPSPWTM